MEEILTVDIQVTLDYMSSKGQGVASLSLMQQKKQNINVNPLTLTAEILPYFCSQLYDREDIKFIMKQEFDLIMMQPLFNECSLGLIHALVKKNNASLILFARTSAPNFCVDKIGGYHPASFVSNFFLGLKQEMNFLERMLNLGTNVIYDMISHFHYIPIMEKTYRNKLGNDVPSANEILGKTSLILSNSHFSLSGGKLNLPNVVDVGGIHSRPAEPLPKDLEEFVSNSGQDGFILFSLGTGLRSSEMSEQKRRMRLFNGRNCPFCAEAEVKVSHCALCSNFKPLWLTIFKILSLSISPTSFSTIIHGLGD